MTRNNMGTLQGGIAHRLSVIGVPRHLIRQLSDLVTKWVECSGKEWTIDRLKTIKTSLIQLHAGSDSSLPWIARNKDGQIKGPFGSLIRWSLRSEKNFNKALQACMVYSMFAFTKLTEKQTEKFVSAVQDSDPNMLPKNFYDSFGRAIRNSFPLAQIDRRSDNSLLVFRGSASKRSPGFSWSPSTPQDKAVINQADYFYLREHKVLFRQFHGLYNPVIEGLSHHQSIANEALSDTVVPSRVYGGNIAFIQECGGKLRSVASPYLVHQLALKHFGKTLYRMIQSLPWDCTHDQSKPFGIVKDHLSKSLKVHSIDLSSATDHFPLSVQLVALRSLFGNQPDIDLFEVLSRSTWRSSIGNIQWTKGQPLGLYPSFGSFTLTHGLVLWYLNDCCHDNKFFVVGDDVIILDDELAHSYKAILQTMGCPSSPTKSVTSNKLAEFAGKIITKSGVVSQMKWREMSNDNFLDLCRMLGPKSRSLLTNRQKLVFDKIKHCLPPFGLNFSYHGSSYESMQELTEKTFSVEEILTQSLTGLSSVINNNILTSEYQLHEDENPPLVDIQSVLHKVTTFDEKVLSVLKQYLPWRQLSPVGGFAGLPAAFQEESELPHACSSPSRYTSLDRLEKLLAVQASK